MQIDVMKERDIDIRIQRNKFSFVLPQKSCLLFLTDGRTSHDFELWMIGSSAEEADD